MADNYLERQRDDYEARKALWLKSHKKGILHKCTRHDTEQENEKDT